MESVERVVYMAPEMAARRSRADHKGHWVNPASWVGRVLLPNATSVQDTVVKLYKAISTPANMTDAEALMAPNLVYQGPMASGLLPACIADVGSLGTLEGPEAWASSLEAQASGFNGSTSELVGNLTCRPTRTANVLSPQLMCVARHACTYTLKRVHAVGGAMAVLTGEILERFWFDTHGRIVRYQTDADPALFHSNVTAANTSNASAAASMVELPGLDMLAAIGAY